MSAFKLDPDLMKRIAGLETDVHSAVDDLRAQFDEKSERWQESDAGNETLAWLDGLEDFAEQLAAVADEPEA